MTLMEVLVALAIFLLSLVALSRLLELGVDQALEIQQRNRAAQLCHSKMAEVVAGAVPLTGQTDVPFPEDSDWLWSMDCEQSSVAGLWNVTVRVRFDHGDDTPVEEEVSRLVLDPSQRGSSADVSSSSNSSSSNNSSNLSSTSSSGTSGSAGMSAGGGAAAPAASSTTGKGTSSPTSTKAPSGGKGP
jgi:type II secretion system protein I